MARGVGKPLIGGQLEIESKAAMFRRDGGKCVRCCKSDRVCWSHVKRRSADLRIKYIVTNVLTMCFTCHDWWHGEPTESGAWFEDRYPDRLEYLDAMVVAHQGMGTLHVHELLEILDQLREYGQAAESTGQQMRC
jgi:hypothetical protein